MNTEVMFSSKDTTWETPQDFFDEINKEFNFSTDVCATEETKKCLAFYSKKDNAFNHEWTGTCWMNPPYGREIGNWIKKAHESAQEGATVVALLPARTDTKWFHNYICDMYEIRFIKGRLKFGGHKNSAPFPSMLVVFKKKKSLIEKIFS